MHNWSPQKKNELADVEKRWQKNGLFKKKKGVGKPLLLLGLFVGNLAVIGLLFVVV